MSALADANVERAVRGYLEERFAPTRVLGGVAAKLLAGGAVSLVPALVRPDRLADPNKALGYDADTSRVELARLVHDALGSDKRAALLVEDGAAKRTDPWYARYGLDAPHAFVDGQLVVFTTHGQRPTKAQLKALLAIGESAAGLVGVVAPVSDDLLDLEEEDVSREDLLALVEAPLLSFAAAYQGEGFVALTRP